MFVLARTPVIASDSNASALTSIRVNFSLVISAARSADAPMAFPMPNGKFSKNPLVISRVKSTTAPRSSNRPVIEERADNNPPVALIVTAIALNPNSSAVRAGFTLTKLDPNPAVAFVALVVASLAALALAEPRPSIASFNSMSVCSDANPRDGIFTLPISGISTVSNSAILYAHKYCYY